jgi:peptidoglycan/LPS O-acetylase OafA/YrhL
MFGIYRTFLALLVVIGHIGGVHSIGGYAVFGFFVLSGYLMTLIMETSYGYSKSGFSKYLLNRFLRIYPIYWVSIAFSLALIALFGGKFISDYHGAIQAPVSLLDIAKNILLILSPQSGIRLTPPAWALTVELFFYILIGLGLSRNKKIVIVWFSLSLAFHLIALATRLDWHYRYSTLYAASLPFSTGALIYHYREQAICLLKSKIGRLWNTMPFILLVLGMTNWLLAHVFSEIRGLFFLPNYAICSLMVLVLCSDDALPYISKKLDKSLGDLSYPVYLIHYQVGLLVIVALAGFGIDTERPSPELLLISLPAIILAAWGITLSLERPIDLIRTRVKKSA